MGVSFVNGSWRAAKSVGGEFIVKYCRTKEEAERENERLTAISDSLKNNWSHRYKKRSNAKAADLPVGFVDTVDRKKGKNGERYEYTMIKAIVKINGKVRVFSLSYSDKQTSKRSRKQAIKELKDHLLRLNVKVR